MDKSCSRVLRVVSASVRRTCRQAAQPLRMGVFAAGLVTATLGCSSAAWAIDGIEREVALLRWLDKSTARVDTVEVPVNQQVHIENLDLIVRACVERPPEEPPESAAFLDVWERHDGQPAAEVFRGWMFASSPALSAMEHPIYDLWVIDCLNADEQPSVPAHPADDGPRLPSSASQPSSAAPRSQR